MLKNPFTLLVLGVIAYLGWMVWQKRNSGAERADPHADSSSNNAPNGTPGSNDVFTTAVNELRNIFNSITTIANTVPKNT